MIPIMMKMELEKINELNPRYNKSKLNSIFSLLKHLDIEEKGLIYDPISKETIKLSRVTLFLKCWSLYFKELYPLLQDIPRDKKMELIHLIFGNENHNIESLWFNWPNLVIIAKEFVTENLEIHKKNLKENVKYEIKH